MSKTICDCPKCKCEIELATAVKHGGKSYCSDACVPGHSGGAACACSGCKCCEG